MRVRVHQNLKTLFYAPFYLARVLGLFVREGLDLDLTTAIRSIDSSEALLDGSLDLMWAGPIRVLKAHAERPDSPLRFFCEVVSRDPFCLVGRSARPSFRRADLAAQRVSAVSEVPTPWVCLAADIAAAGLPPVTPVKTYAMAEQVAALDNGSIDVAQLPEPFVSALELAGSGALLLAAASRGPTAYTGFIATEATLRRREGLAEAATRALVGSLGWLRSRPADEVAAALAADYPEVEPHLLAAAIDRYLGLGVWSEVARPSPEGLGRPLAAMRHGGLVSRSVDVERIIYRGR